MDSHIYIVLDFDGVLHHAMAGPSPTHLSAKPFDCSKFIIDVNKANAEVAQWDHETLNSENRLRREHGKGEFRGLFDRMSKLQKLLELLPTAQILIATSWRNKIDLTDLCKFFPKSIEKKIAGSIDCDPSNDAGYGVRGALAEKWLKERRDISSIWIALDDQPLHYWQHFKHLVQTPSCGMNEETIEKVVQRINSLRTADTKELYAL
jgi:hypothetical protein